MQNILSEAAMEKLLTLATEAQYQKAAAAILAVIVGGASFYLLLLRPKPSATGADLPPIPEPPVASDQTPPNLSEQESVTSHQESVEQPSAVERPSRSFARHIPAPINTLLTAVGLPGVETPKITPEDKIVKAAPESYRALAPGGQGLEIHEEFKKQNSIDKAEAARVRGMEEAKKTVETETDAKTEGDRREAADTLARDNLNDDQPGRSRLGRIRTEESAAGEVAAPQPEVEEEEIDTDREDFQSLGGESSTDREEFESLAGDGEDVEMEDMKSWAPDFEDEYL